MAGTRTPKRGTTAPITHLRPILGVKGGVGFSRDLWRECQLSETLCSCPCSISGPSYPSPAHLVERLEADDEADWWRRAASAAASMSTSLRERGTFSVFRERFSSSRPFRLSERPKRISERELGKRVRDLRLQCPGQLHLLPHFKDASMVQILHPTRTKGPNTEIHQNFLDGRRFLMINYYCYPTKFSLSPP